MKKPLLSYNSDIKLVHVVTIAALLVGFVGMINSQLGRIDKLDITQQTIITQIDKVDDHIAALDKKLDVIGSDLHYLRGFVDVQRKSSQKIKLFADTQDLHEGRLYGLDLPRDISP